MFLARIVGTKQEVFHMVGSHQVRSWQFWSYERGASAIAHTELQAIVAARRELARKAIARLYTSSSEVIA